MGPHTLPQINIGRQDFLLCRNWQSICLTLRLCPYHPSLYLCRHLPGPRVYCCSLTWYCSIVKGHLRWLSCFEVCLSRSLYVYLSCELDSSFLRLVARMWSVTCLICTCAMPVVCLFGVAYILGSLRVSSDDLLLEWFRGCVHSWPLQTSH